MFTLADFDQGRLYASLYKDLYGYRPRQLSWGSPEEFEADLEALQEEVENIGTDDDKTERDWADEDTVFFGDSNSLENELGYNPFDERIKDDWY